MFYVYVLESLKCLGELYVGSTDDLKRRFTEHNAGKVTSTTRYLPWRLIYYEAYLTDKLARNREKKLKHHGNAMRELKKRIGVSSDKKSDKGRKSDKGFTLLETMIYIGLFAILISGVVVGAYNLLEGSDRNITAARIQEEGTFLNRKINWALSGATNATISGGGSQITITRPDLGAQSPLVISGTLNAMTIARGIGAPVQLNSDRFLINNVVFTYQASVNGRPPSVSVNFLVQDKPFFFRGYLRQ